MDGGIHTTPGKGKYIRSCLPWRVISPPRPALHSHRVGHFFSPVSVVFFLLSFFSLSTLSDASQMNICFWPRCTPFRRDSQVTGKESGVKKTRPGGVFIMVTYSRSYSWTTFAAAGPLAPSTTSNCSRLSLILPTSLLPC